VLHRIAKLRALPAALLVFVLASGTPAWSDDSFFGQFIDPKDGMLDNSQVLAKRTGFLPVPIVISEPAVGYGLGAALTFFHERQSGDPEDEPPRDIYGDPMLSLPPSVSLVAGAATENGSWLVGGGHLGFYREDSLRYEGFVGYASLNLTFFGLGRNPALENKSADFNIEGLLISQELKHRVPQLANGFLGARYQYLNPRVTFDLGLPAGIGQGEVNEPDAGLTALYELDTRSNTLSPQDGHNTKFEVGYHGEALGGTAEYWKARARSLSYWDIAESFNLGVRGVAEAAGEDAPFYQKPFIQMRGIPALRYQGDEVLTGELELRIRTSIRWHALVFGGAGIVLDEEQPHGAAGIGFRYLLTRRLGLQVGLDLAQGPEDTVLYIQVGHAWRR